MKIERNELFFLLREYLQNFLPKQKCVSSHTLKSYRESLNLFITYLAEQKKCSLYHITFDHVTAASVESFLLWLKEERSCYHEPATFRNTCIFKVLRRPQP